MNLEGTTIAIALAATLLGGCAAAPPPRAAAGVADAAPAQGAIDHGPSSYESEIGGLSDYDVGHAVEGLRDDLGRCLSSGGARIAALGGHLKISLRVGTAGTAKWVYLSESTLGDRETEKCIVDRARAKVWPKPLSGDGLIQTSFDIDAQTPPVQWEAKRVNQAVSAARRATVSCRHGIVGGFHATAYVGPDGRVAAAGVAPPSEKGEGAADCVVDAIRQLRFQSAPRMAKVSFEVQ